MVVVCAGGFGCGVGLFGGVFADMLISLVCVADFVCLFSYLCALAVVCCGFGALVLIVARWCVNRLFMMVFCVFVTVVVLVILCSFNCTVCCVFGCCVGFVWWCVCYLI